MAKHTAIWRSRVGKRLLNPADMTAAVGMAILCLLGEAVLCSLIIARVPYTEIDWQAYMQQVKGFLQGERDYAKLEGSTGPLVYPAGHLYLYTWLQAATGGGSVRLAQSLFVLFYLGTQALVLWLYTQAKVLPPVALPMLCLSKRLHSIYLLRLFNDGPAMLLAYAATALLVAHQWVPAIVAFSAAVSVKMNVLLMAPSVLLIVLKGATVADVGQGVALGVLLQLGLALPFLLHRPGSYLGRAFELSRVFQHQWSVNLKFLPEPVFQARWLAAGLLAAHVGTLWLFARYHWCRPEGGFAAVWQGFVERSRPAGGSSAARSRRADPARSPSKVPAGSDRAGSRSSGGSNGKGRLRADQILGILFAGNFVGIVFSRTLHFQFYAWYCQQLPLLLWQVQMHWIVRVGLCFAIELVWNVYPSTPTSSLSLLACHACILIGLWVQPRHAKPL